MHVIIIGGGTGGMCLAHGLKKAGMSVAVYERYASRDDGLYGYRVGIDPTGNRALQECLPPDRFAAFVATCARTPLHFNVLNERLQTTASFPLRGDADPVNCERSVSRATLRRVLFEGMDDVLHFGHVYTHYTHNSDGTVTAHFENGETATADLLVSAEGTQSAVRRQYLPHAQLVDTGVTALATKTPLNAQTRALLPPHVAQGLSLIFAKQGLIGMLHVMEFPKAQGTPADADYINLSIWSATSRFPAGTNALRGTALLELALRQTEGWSPALRSLFQQADPATAFPLQIATSKPVAPWTASNITLLGDAIHTMTPGQGVGANTALRDAAWLCRELAAVHGGNKTLLDAIADYEAEMRDYGFARVADSLNNNGTRGNDPLYHPVAGPVTLLAARAYFAITSWVPALRRNFVASLYQYRGAS